MRYPLLAVAALTALIPTGTLAETGRVAWVTDGDTFRLDSGERIRIADIDAPETMKRQAKCMAEIALGKAATSRARTLLEGHFVTFERTGRSWRRTVARVTLDGRDVSALLVDIGVARPWLRGDAKPDWCPVRHR
jgi:endonuclease YncB( thermonuclease family)